MEQERSGDDVSDLASFITGIIAEAYPVSPSESTTRRAATRHLLPKVLCAVRQWKKRSAHHLTDLPLPAKKTPFTTSPGVLKWKWQQWCRCRECRPRPTASVGPLRPPTPPATPASPVLDLPEDQEPVPGGVWDDEDDDGHGLSPHPYRTPSPPTSPSYPRTPSPSSPLSPSASPTFSRHRIRSPTPPRPSRWRRDLSPQPGPSRTPPVRTLSFSPTTIYISSSEEEE